MYRWGKMYGWAPVARVGGVPQPPLAVSLQ
jgi:hypothetical protein